MQTKQGGPSVVAVVLNRGELQHNWVHQHLAISINARGCLAITIFKCTWAKCPVTSFAFSPNTATIS